MILHSLEDLECLLPDDMREKVRKEKAKQAAELPPFNFMKTENRVLPLLPRWMKNKLVEAKILYDHNNTSYGNQLLWNHLITLKLDEQHDVTFAILDNYLWGGDMREPIRKVVEVYKDLQVLYRKYGHSLSILSLQTDDFGMFLPTSFYENGTQNDEETESAESLRASWGKQSFEDFMKQLMEEDTLRIQQVMNDYDEYANTLNEEEREQFYAEINAENEKRFNYVKDVYAVMKQSANRFFMQYMWDCVDIYLSGSPKWGREFCVKWNLGERLGRLRKLETLRPLVDAIIQKTETETFAFGVKKRGTEVIPCDPVRLRARYYAKMTA